MTRTINWIQVQPGSGLTYSSRTASTPAQWAALHWMRDSQDERLRWIYARLEVQERCDVSDATITYSLLTAAPRCFLFGAGNPEDFFFLGKRQSDGTRTGGKQSEIIQRLAGTAANTFHVLALRDSRYNIEPVNGTPDCNPFAELVARTDNFRHPIAQMFQILYYDEIHPDQVGPEDYVNDPHVKMMTWGHYATEEKGQPPIEKYYQELVGHGQEAAGRYVLLNTEVDKHPNAGSINRLYCWTSALANRYTARSSHRPDKTNVPHETFVNDGRIRTFMEGTDFHRMAPKSDQRHGSTLYVLAGEAGSYIAYSNNAVQPMGLRNVQAGTYLLRWFDTVDGGTVEQVVAVTAGDQAWARPTGIGPEAALYLKRLDGVVPPASK